MAVDWLKLKTDYIKDPSASVDSIATKHGVNPSYARYIAGQQKWKDERDRIQQKTSEKLAEKLPESLAEVKLRHARIGRNVQSTAMRALAGDIAQGIKPIQPSSYGEAVGAIVKGVQLERQALGLNDKEVMDEVVAKFQQFTFIFNLGDDELRRFISAIEPGGTTPDQSTGHAALPASTEGADGGSVGAPSVPA